MNSADYAREQGWQVGTRLFGAATDVEGWRRIEITAIGRQHVLAVTLDAQNFIAWGRESLYGFDYRKWSVIE